MKHFLQTAERLCSPLSYAISISLLVLFCVGINGHAQSLPIVGSRLWEINYKPNVATGAIDYAPGVDLVFSGTQGGAIYVVNGTTGTILDTIRTDSWFLTPGGRPLSHISDVSCSLDGRFLCVAASTGDDKLGKVVLMEYPSKRIVMDSLYYGSNYWAAVRIKVSPSGRYVVVPVIGGIDNRWVRLYDRIRDTSVVFSSYVYHDRGDFDTDERYFVFPTLGKARGELVYNQIALLKLDDLSKPAKLIDEYGFPEISADGRYLMNSGYGYPYTATPAYLFPSRISVIDIATDSVFWKLDAQPTTDNNGYAIDLYYCAWAEDASRFYAERRSTKIPAEWRGRAFYNVGDSVPKAMMCDRPWLDNCYFSGNIHGDRIGCVSNPQLTIGFTNGGTGLRAELLTPTTSVLPLTPVHIGDGVYPNPTTGEVHVRCKHVVSAKRWSLTGIKGEMVVQGMVSAPETGSDCLIPLPREIASGVYIITLVDSKQQPLCSHKVIKQ